MISFDELHELLEEREKLVEYRDCSDDTLEYRSIQSEIDKLDNKLRQGGVFF